MYAGFSAQPAIGIFAGDFDSRGLNAGDFPFRLFNDFRLEAARFRPTQIHTQQHAGPVLRFSTTRTGLNIEIAIGAIVLAGEHPAEFQLRQFLFQRIQLRDGFVKRLFVVSFYRQFQQPENVVQPLSHLIKRIDDRFER